MVQTPFKGDVTCCALRAEAAGEAGADWAGQYRRGQDTKGGQKGEGREKGDLSS